MVLMENTENNKKIIDIYTTKVTRRILVFLADIFLCLILSICLNELVINPIARSIINYENVINDSTLYSENRSNVLIDNNLLFQISPSNYNFNENIVYTSKQYIRYYVMGDNENYDVIYNYFITIKNEDITYLNNLLISNCSDYFNKDIYTSLGTYSLKEEIKNLIKPYYTPGDKISSEGESLYNELQKQVFLSLYSLVIRDIQECDLSSPNNINLLSYNTYTNLININNDKINLTYTIDSFISFFLSVTVLFFVIPFTNKKGQTLSEKILKIEHVDKNTLKYPKKRFIFVLGLFNTLNSTCLILFIPMISLGFSEVFSLNYLFAITLVGIVFILIELILVSFTNFNQSLKELGTNSIVVDSSTMDEYFLYKVYGKK